MTDLIVESRVNDAPIGNYVAADFYEVLDQEVAERLEDAVGGTRSTSGEADATGPLRPAPDSTHIKPPRPTTFGNEPDR